MAKNQFDFEIHGLGDLTGKLKRLEVDMAPNLEGAMAKGAVPLYHRARENCPVDTGYLKSTIQVERLTSGLKGRGVKKVEVALTAGAPYAAYVEFGTRKMAPRAFMRRAIQETQAKVGAIVAADMVVRVKTMASIK